MHNEKTAMRNCKFVYIINVVVVVDAKARPLLHSCRFSLWALNCLQENTFC